MMQEIQEKVENKLKHDEEVREKLEKQTVNNPTNNTQHTRPPVEQNDWLSTFSNVLWNIAPLVLFASFMYIVQLVLQSS